MKIGPFLAYLFLFLLILKLVLLKTWRILAFITPKFIYEMDPTLSSDITFACLYAVAWSFCSSKMPGNALYEIKESVLLTMKCYKLWNRFWNESAILQLVKVTENKCDAFNPRTVVVERSTASLIRSSHAQGWRFESGFLRSFLSEVSQFTN